MSDNQVKYPLIKTERQKRIDDLRYDALGATGQHSYVVASERDTPDPFKSRGAILMETYLGDASLVKAVSLVEKISDGCGRKQIFKLVPVDFDEAKEAVST